MKAIGRVRQRYLSTPVRHRRTHLRGAIPGKNASTQYDADEADARSYAGVQQACTGRAPVFVCGPRDAACRLGPIWSLAALKAGFRHEGRRVWIVSVALSRDEADGPATHTVEYLVAGRRAGPATMTRSRPRRTPRTNSPAERRTRSARAPTATALTPWISGTRPNDASNIGYRIPRQRPTEGSQTSCCAWGIPAPRPPHSPTRT